MPAFLDPFSGKIPDRPLIKEEIIRALRLDLAAEEEAVHLYTAHADAIKDVQYQEIVEMLRIIAEEELVHAGEFLRLITELNKGDVTLMRQGAEEVEDKTGLPKISYEPMTAR